MTSGSDQAEPWSHDSTEACLNHLGDKAYDKQLGVLHCNGTWDAILCWPAAAAGTVIKQPCPPMSRGVDETKFSFRECQSNGVWAGVSDIHPIGVTDYSECYTTESRDVYLMIFSKTSPSLMKTIARGTRLMEIVGLSISFVTLIISVFIFCFFRNLRCDRTRMHRNLFVAILIHDAILLVVHVDQMIALTSGDVIAGALVSAPGTIYATPTVCEILCVLVEYTKTVTFMWMLMEGVYLHNTLVAAVYSSNPNYIVFYIIGWGLALIPTAIWAVVTIHKNRNRCWFLYQLHLCYWIIEGPRIVVIVKWLVKTRILLTCLVIASSMGAMINGCFLLSIVRELIVKLKANNTSEACQAWKAARATLILLPLLGINNILSMTKPPFDRPIQFALWSYSAFFFSSFQGFFVSVFYCFINAEVRLAVTLHWRKRRQSQRLVVQSKYRSRSTTEMLSTPAPANMVLENIDAFAIDTNEN